MDNGHEERLVEKFSGVGLRESSNENDSLFQVIKAVEAAEATIKQQVFVAFIWTFTTLHNQALCNFT